MDTEVNGMKRDIRPEEMEVIVRLAAKYADLHAVEKDLAEIDALRERVKEFALGASKPDAVEPRSVSDLLKLAHEGYIQKAEVARRLGLDSVESPDLVAPALKTIPSNEDLRARALALLRKTTGNASWVPQS